MISQRVAVQRADLSFETVDLRDYRKRPMVGPLREWQRRLPEFPYRPAHLLRGPPDPRRYPTRRSDQPRHAQPPRSRRSEQPVRTGLCPVQVEDLNSFEKWGRYIRYIHLLN